MSQLSSILMLFRHSRTIGRRLRISLSSGRSLKEQFLLMLGTPFFLARISFGSQGRRVQYINLISTLMINCCKSVWKFMTMFSTSSFADTRVTSTRGKGKIALNDLELSLASTFELMQMPYPAYHMHKHSTIRHCKTGKTIFTSTANRGINGKILRQRLFCCTRILCRSAEHQQFAPAVMAAYRR